MNAAELVKLIHETPHKAVMAITGGGSEAIGELLRHGNGSKTLLEAVVPYDQGSFEEFVRGKPDKYCSPGAARDLAMAAYMRAGKLNKNFDNVIGIGATCSLTKEGERDGRKHYAYIAVQTGTQTDTFNYELLPGTREAQETLVANFILNELARACGIRDDLIRQDEGIAEESAEYLTALGWENDLIHGRAKSHTVAVNAVAASNLMLCGSFNPVHDQHIAMAKVAAKRKGGCVDFEVCVRNVDKTPLNYLDISVRTVQLTAAMNDQPWAGNIVYSTAPTFAQKADLFPGTTFVIGFDTLKRIGDLKYYDGDHEKRFRAIERIHQQNCRFLVFHRITDGKCSNEEEAVLLPTELIAITEIVPTDELPASSTSSSEIRKGKK